MKRTKFSFSWKQTVALLLFFATSFGVAAVSLGYFALPSDSAGGDVALSPFWPVRPPADDKSDPDSTTASSTGENDVPLTPSGGVTYLTNLSRAFNAALIEGYLVDRTAVSLGERLETYNKLAAGIETLPDGAPVSYESYTADGYKLVRGSRMEGAFTEGTEVIVRYTKVYSSEDGSYQTMATEYTIDRKKVQPYMGYLILSQTEMREGTAEASAPVTLLTLCDCKGNVLVSDLGDKYPYYARDNQNRPVFTDNDGKFYAFDGQDFIEIKESSLRVWLRYDYPAYPLGVYKDYEVSYDPETGKYKYVNCENGRTAISTDYFKAFNFDENGYAVIVSATDNSLSVVNSSKRIQFRAKGYYKYPTGDTGHNLNARDIFRLPDTLGIESIGSAGYDHGWLRIRVQALSQMSNSRGTVIRDWEALVDTEGNFFEIPEGYTLEGYSDGILLLSKNGLYGYYSIKGEWITQPIFTYARPFIQGLAVVGSESGTVGMIDTDGNIVLPFVYSSLSDVSSGVITAYCEGIGWETYYLVTK